MLPHPHLSAKNLSLPALLALIAMNSSCSTLVPVDERRKWISIPAPDGMGGLANGYCGASGHQVHIFGGIDEDQESPLNNAGYTYDIDGKRWSHWNKEGGPPPIWNFAALETPQALFVFGGEAKEHADGLNSLYRFGFKDQAWTRIPGGESLRPRWRSSLLTLGNKILIYGGKSQDSELDAALYDEAGKAWIPVDVPEALGTRSSHVAVAYKDTALILGGFRGKERRGDAFLFDARSGRWRELSSPLDPRANSKVLIDESRAYILGGASEGDTTIFGAEFDFEDESWKEIPGIEGFADYRGFAVGLVPSEGIYLWGGRTRLDIYNDSHYFYRFGTRAWSKLEALSAPPGTQGGCLAYTDSGELVAFGGIYRLAGEGLKQLSGLWVLPAKAD